MRNNLFCKIILLLFLSSTIIAQDAPNFTITDTDGVEHRLYEDYLDQGKTVMIKIFFVNCPPCRSIAPSVQTLYEEWGEGTGDVQFFELSNKSFDDNNDVAAWHSQLGLTFPGAGEDGGALDAVNPYTSGVYGLFFGTPTFVVIAPDRSVNYDVASGPIAEQISDIDAALLATGATKPENNVQPAVFDINIVDAFGNDINDFNLRLESETSNLSFPINLNSGQLSILDIATDFPGLANPVLRISKNDEFQDKLSAIDILIIVRHILGLIPITEGERLLAADTNGDGLVNAIDLITLQRAILGLIPEFPNSETYQFFPNEIAIFPQAGQTQNLEFIGVKIGDLNGF